MIDTYTPDDDPTATYAAVGMALTAWEHLEQTFAAVYCTLKGSLADLNVMRAYMNAGPIFDTRMSVLQGAANAYFVRKPDQQLEGDLGALIVDARLLSKERHRIAHGVVVPRAIMWTPDGEFGSEFRLVPPWYAMEKLAKPDEFYRYGSAEIHLLAKQFLALRERVSEFDQRLQASPGTP